MVYSMTELQQQAVVTIATTETYGIRRWINSVNLLYDQGHIALENYDLENAYIFFMRGFSIMIEVVKQHPHYSDILTDPLYIQLKKKTNEDVYLLLKYLAEKIQSGPYLKQPHYAYRPSHDPRNFPHYSVHHRPLFTSPSHPFIPNTLHIEPTDIIRWLKSSSPPRLLFIDVRPKHVFRKGSIRYRWILQIDPKCVMTEHSVLEYLKQEESQQRMFRERNQFDLVICYDQAQYPPVFNQLKSLISTKCMFLVDGL
ncbi:hypothetical protein BDB01DRAFT_363086 [Pilobolus umbonatus]|nr:hypothetical protein BDB01DRAFT_363086 [Pilobolus umbonatus]